MGLYTSYVDDIMLLKKKEKPRDREIYKKHKLGINVNEISENYGLSKRSIQFIIKKQRMLDEWDNNLNGDVRMNETHCYLVSNNIHNFRHNKENPIIIGVYSVTPENLHPRPCFKVLYSDGKVDYVPCSSIQDGDNYISLSSN